MLVRRNRYVEDAYSVRYPRRDVITGTVPFSDLVSSAMSTLCGAESRVACLQEKVKSEGQAGLGTSLITYLIFPPE